MALDKINKFGVIVIIVLSALIPPIDFSITPPLDYWPWLVLIAMFSGIFMWFLNVPFLPKIVSTFVLLDCFTSCAPYVSFGVYVSVVMGCYFYCMCERIKDNTWVFKALQAIVIINILMLIVQAFHKDNLLNFGLSSNNCFGSVGQHMQAGSFMTVISAILLPFFKYNLIVPFVAAIFTHSVWTFFSWSVGMIVYFTKTWKEVVRYGGALLIIFLLVGLLSGKFTENTSKNNGRLKVWTETVKLANQRPLTGWGPGTYKLVFPTMSKMKTNPWMTAHNFWAQMLFEVGYIGTIAIILFQIIVMGVLVHDLRRRVWRGQALILLTSCAMILSDFMAHFPDRMLQCIPMMIFFLSYVINFIRKGDFYVSNVTG